MPQFSGLGRRVAEVRDKCGDAGELGVFEGVERGINAFCVFKVGWQEEVPSPMSDLGANTLIE